MPSQHRQKISQQSSNRPNAKVNNQIPTENPEVENKDRMTPLKMNPMINGNSQGKLYKTIEIQPKQNGENEGKTVGNNGGRIRVRSNKKSQLREGLSLERYRRFRKESAEIDLPGLDMSNYKNRQIAEIYLSKCPLHKNSCHSSRNGKKIAHRKKVTADCTMQTDGDNAEEVKNIQHKKLQPINKQKMKIGPIEENESDEQARLINRKHEKNIKGINNTISFTKSLNTNRVNVDRYLQSINKNEYNFNSAIRRYRNKQQYPQQITKFSSIDFNQKNNNFMNNISQNQKYNLWDNVSNKSIENKYIVNGYQNQKYKKKFYLHNNNNNNNNNQNYQNNSNKNSYINNNHHPDQIKSISEYKQVSIISKQVQNSVQTLDIKCVQIGTDTNNNNQKPAHPINNQNNQNDNNWIKQHYQPKSQFLNNIDTNNFIIKKYKNGVYFGQLNQSGLKDGIGVIFYFNGKSYQGNFINDMKEGKGYQYLPNGSTYEGDFHNGMKQGKGVYQWANGEIYVGQWVGGKKNGSGTWKSPRGDSYIGEWKNDIIEGFGVLSVKEGDRYQGQFKKSTKNGLGTERYSNGDTYVGQFYKNKPNGQGEYYSSNGDHFKGVFSNGLRHGNGVQKKIDGGIYTGQYRNDKKCGYGQLLDGQKNIYNGNFENDLKHGYGEEKNVDNQIKKGYWINGQFIMQYNKVMDDKSTFMELVKKKQRQKKQRQRGRERQRQRQKSKGKNGLDNNSLDNNNGRLDGRQKRIAGKSPKLNNVDSSQKLDPSYYRPCGCLKKH